MSKGRVHKRRPLKSKRRGRGSNRAADEKQKQQYCGEQEKVDKDSCLYIQQGNIGSFTACVNELRSRLDQEQPHVAIFQEVGTWPNGSCPYHFPGYSLIYCPRVIPRSENQVRGGGIAILIRNDMKNRLSFDRLHEINLGYSAAEIVRVRLYFKNPTGCTILDVVNIYCPPVSSSTTDCRSQEFDMNDILEVACSENDDEAETYASRAILLGGDINAHSKIWDKNT